MLREELKNNSHTDDKLMFNIQFIGEGYKLINSEELKLANKWEAERMKYYTNNVWLDYIREPISSRKVRIGYSQDLWIIRWVIHSPNNKKS